MEKKQPLLSVKNLKINFSTDHGYVQAVRGVSFDLYKGETLCIVGESGSGKSVTNKAIMGILSSNGRIVDGSIMYQGEDLTKVSEDEFHRIRGHKIGMIFQDPLSSLNPIVKIGKQITEAMLINASRTKKLYEELVSNELVAYKNAETELKSGINGAKERVKFLKAEKKKEIAQARNKTHNVIDGEIYGLEKDFGAKEFSLDEKCDRELNDLKTQFLQNKIDKNTYDLEVKKVKKELKQNKAALKKEFNDCKVKARSKKAELTEASKQTIEEIKNRYDKEIEEANATYNKIKIELKEKYDPLIKKYKKQYFEKSKEARVEVKKFKTDAYNEYDKKKGLILAYRFNQSSSKTKKEIEEVTQNYVSSLRITRSEAKARAIKIMEEVGIKDAAKRYNQYPFEFSGGMRQRIVIAIALTADPDILICDEPTTALDVTIQAQILELINRLKKERQLSCIFITHDLGVVANMADRVAVMYAGKIVEYGTEEDIFYNPKHPYTWALLSSIPDVDSNEKLDAIPGTPPNMIYPPKGDAFALRSKYAMEIDFKKEPPFFKVSDTHYAATWLLDPRAPKVEMPKIVKTRIEKSLKAAKKEKVK